MILDLSDTPPIFFTEIQKSQGLGTFVAAFLAFFFFVITYSLLQFFKFNIFRKNTADIQAGRLCDLEASDRFILNFNQLFIKLVKPEYRRIAESPSKAMSWIFLILWFISIILIENGLEKINPNLNVGRDERQIQVGLLVYLTALIAYFITRVLSFYREKLQVRKKIKAHQQSLAKNILDIQTHPVSIQTNQIVGLFDQDFNYRRRIKHITPILHKINPTLLNLVQIIVVVTEFFQLASFPLRDLFRSTAFLQSLQLAQGKSSQKIVDAFRSFMALFSTGIASTDLNYVKFVFCWWITLSSVLIASAFMVLRFVLAQSLIPDTNYGQLRKYMTKISHGAWVIIPLPLINLFYLLILNAFLEPLGCLSSNLTPTWLYSLIRPAGFDDSAAASQKRMYECNQIYNLHPSMHTWYALSGFTMAFLIFTLSRVALEPRADEGCIHYTSSSELFTKCASIILLLLYTLIPTAETTTLRGVMASVLLITMVVYNTVIGSTYSRWINFARSISYITTLWMCMVIVYYTHPNNTLLIFESGSDVWTTMTIGSICLWIIYSIVYYFCVISWENRCDSDSFRDDVELLGNAISEVVADIEDGRLNDNLETDYSLESSLRESMSNLGAIVDQRVSGPRPIKLLQGRRSTTLPIVFDCTAVIENEEKGDDIDHVQAQPRPQECDSLSDLSSTVIIIEDDKAFEIANQADSSKRASLNGVMIRQSLIRGPRPIDIYSKS